MSKRNKKVRKIKYRIMKIHLFEKIGIPRKNQYKIVTNPF